MVMMPSNMMPLGTTAPDFTLPDTVSGNDIALHDVKSDKATVVLFICNHCPFVVLIAEKLAEVARVYHDRGVQFIAISANDIDNYPQDAPDKMQQFAEQHGFVFPYLYDADQAVAKAYDAACTPDIYVFDGNLACVYRGQFDDARPGNGKAVTGRDLTTALDLILAGKPVPEQQTPSTGCSIKWK